MTQALFELFSDKYGSSIAQDANPGLDTVGWVLDLYEFDKQLTQSFQREPQVLRSLAPHVKGVGVNAKFKDKSFVFNRVGRPDYAMMAKQSDRDIDASAIDVPLPEIYMSFTFHERKWEQLFGGKDRGDTFLFEARNEIKNEEEIIGFQGSAGAANSSGVDVKGLVSTSTTDLGSPTGVWDVDTGSNGILNNLNADVRKGTKAAAGNSFKTQPLHIVWTGYIDELAAGYAMAHLMTDNKQKTEKMLRGGRIFVTDLVQASVTENANTIVMLVDLPTNERGWELISSGLQIKLQENGVLHYTQLLREIFSIKIKRATSVMWMNAIDTVT